MQARLDQRIVGQRMTSSSSVSGWVSGYTWAALAAFAALSCSENVAALRPDEFVRVTIESGGGSSDCPDLCWRRMGIEAPGLLVLVDPEGTERFDLKAEQYQDALEIVMSDGFRRAIEDPDDCHSHTGGSPTVVIESTDGENSDDTAGSCTGRPNELTHPYAKLYWLLVELLDEYLECPTVEPGTPMQNGSPPVRYLCLGCWSWPDDQACL